jgi:hypothetical protein
VRFPIQKEKSQVYGRHTWDLTLSDRTIEQRTNQPLFNRDIEGQNLKTPSISRSHLTTKQMQHYLAEVLLAQAITNKPQKTNCLIC